MYGSVNLADTYFAGQLFAEAWETASSADKTKALTMATADIDRLRFLSDKVSSSQANEWPRVSVNGGVTPADILIAAYEQAKAYLDGKNQDQEYEVSQLSSQAWASIRTQYNGAVPTHVRAGILSITAWRCLLPYIRPAKHVELVKAM